MTPNVSRSEEVVEDYKKRKLARSAYTKIRDTIEEWDTSRKIDHKLAILGMGAMLIIVVVAVIYFSGFQSRILD
jgi:ACT domain-containing protein